MLDAACAADAVRDGPYGSAWFSGAVTHIEVRGPDFKGSVRGGAKTLFRLPGAGAGPARLVLTEAPIDARSRVALESNRLDTLYAATGGGMGAGTETAINIALALIAALPDAELVSVADANLAGDRYAERHAEMAATEGAAFKRLRPTIGNDWNGVIKHRSAT